MNCVRFRLSLPRAEKERNRITALHVAPLNRKAQVAKMA